MSNTQYEFKYPTQRAEKDVPSHDQEKSLNYLSHEYQNRVAEDVYKRFFREQGNQRYTAAELKNIGDKETSITFKDFETLIPAQIQYPSLSKITLRKTLEEFDISTVLLDILEKHSKAHHNPLKKDRDALSDSKNLLAYCVQQALRGIINAFQENVDRQTNFTPLAAHFTEIDNLMKQALKIEEILNQYYQVKVVAQNRLKDRFKDIQKFCTDKMAALPQVADLRIYRVWISKKDLAAAPEVKQPVRHTQGPRVFDTPLIDKDLEVDTNQAIQQRKERDDIAKAWLGKDNPAMNPTDISKLREDLRVKLTKMSSDYQYRTYTAAIEAAQIYEEHRPTFIFNKSVTISDSQPKPVNLPRTIDSSKGELVYVLDGSDPNNVKNNGIQTGTKVLYKTLDHAFYMRLRYDYSSDQSQGDGLLHSKQQESFISEYSPQLGWKTMVEKETDLAVKRQITLTQSSDESTSKPKTGFDIK